MKRRTYTLLITEDDEDDQTLIRMALKEVGRRITVQFVKSGNEAIAYLKGEGKFADREQYEYPSFLITDLKMSDGDGFAVLEFLKSTPEYSISPVVVLSASLDEHDIEQSYLLGASAYLLKPSSLEYLRRMLKVLVDFWLICEVPAVDKAGRREKSKSDGKLGERFGVVTWK